MISDIFKKEVRAALKIVWIIYSALVLLVLVINVFSAGTLHDISPVCLSKSLNGEECVMCGMTRAFVEISEGNIINAYILNKLSIFLFSVMSLNSILFILFTVKKFRSLFYKRRSDSDFQNKNIFQN